MRGLIALLVIVDLVGVGVALAPTVEAKWTSGTAAQFVDGVGQQLPYALVWPARVYRDIMSRG